MDRHTIHKISEREPEIFHNDDEIALAIIDEDEDEDIPIYGVALENGAYSVFYFKEEGGIRILHVNNENKSEGELSRMMDFITERFGVNDLEFFNITNKDLLNTLNRPSTKTKRINDSRHKEPQKVLIAEVEWEQI